MNNGQRTTDNGQQPFIPYGRQSIDEDDIDAVVEVLRSDWLTTGPKVAEFEQAVADFVGAKEAVAVSNGTAALHAAMYAIGIGAGDEVIVPPMTFAATANCVVFQGGRPVFADVDLDTLLIDPKCVEAKITPNTKAIIAVDYAGQACDYDALRSIAERYDLILVADACHSLGAAYKGKKVGSLADLTVFSFHPVKHITTGEGGMVTTDNPEFAERMRMFRNHGITRNPDKFTVHRSPFTDEQRKTENGQRKTVNGQRSTVNGQRPTDNGQQTTSLWYYEMQDIGFNYRITDFQCALGLSQLKKLPAWFTRRQEIAARYADAFNEVPGIKPLGLRADVQTESQSAERRAQSQGKEGTPSDSTPCSMPSFSNALRPAPCALRSDHAYHLYVIKIDFKALGIDRTELFMKLREKGIGVNVHYVPVHLHPYYRQKFHTGPGLCPVAERAYEQILSLPMFPEMTDDDLERVVENVGKEVKKVKR